MVKTPVASEEQTRIGCSFFLGAGYLLQGLLGLNAYTTVLRMISTLASARAACRVRSPTAVNSAITENVLT